MGKLIRNGIEYGGGNGTDIFEVTQAEYDALKQAGTLVHNALYVISDGDNLNPTADDIEYSSGVTVADMITPIDVSGDISRNTSNVSQFTANCYTVGKVAIFDALDITTSISMGADEVMLTGLPKPLTNQTFILGGYSDMKAYRVRVDTNGNLKAWHNSSSIPNGMSVFGGFSYVTA